MVGQESGGAWGRARDAIELVELVGLEIVDLDVSHSFAHSGHKLEPLLLDLLLLSPAVVSPCTEERPGGMGHTSP